MLCREFYNSIIPVMFRSLNAYSAFRNKCTEENFNTKQSLKSWSAAECIHHLLVTEKSYFPQLESLISENTETDRGLAPFRKTFFGTIMLFSVSPAPRFKLKAPSVFKPETSVTHSLSLLDDYETHNSSVIKLFENASNLDLSELKIHSPATDRIKYNLGETFMIIFNHRLRHIAQAERALSYREGLKK
ncbi:MAG: DinB family protein [Ignavibacteriaceae bacterium]|nr:DinB family protein [Ignavibacteriaceae bacterium]